MLRFSKPIFENVLVSFHEIRDDSLEKTTSNSRVCLWYSFLLTRGTEADLQHFSEKYLLQKKENISEAVFSVRSTKNVYCKILFFVVVILYSWQKNHKKYMTFSKVQGFQPHVHRSYFVEYILEGTLTFWKCDIFICNIYLWVISTKPWILWKIVLKRTSSEVFFLDVFYIGSNFYSCYISGKILAASWDIKIRTTVDISESSKVI